MRNILAGRAPSAHSLLLAGVASLGLALPAAASAQEEELAAPAPPPAESDATGNEIIVTA